MLNRTHRVIIPYEKWRANGLGIVKYREFDLRRLEFGISRRHSLPIQDHFTDKLKLQMVDEMYRELMRRGYTGIHEEWEFAREHFLGSWNDIGYRVSALFEGRTDQYIFHLTENLKQLDKKFAEYQRAIKGRGFIKTIVDWVLWRFKK